MHKTLLLLPGLMCDAAVWAPQVQALAGLARCVVPAYGLQDSLTTMAEQVLASAPTATFAIAGHSMGGRIALEVMRLAPERVERLALLALVREQGMRVMGAHWARAMVHPRVLGTPLFGAVLDMLERSSPNQFAAQINALLTRADAADVLPDIACPTLVLCGREDIWSPPEQHQVIAAAIAGATLCVIKRCGHMATVERPDEVNAALVAWLSQSQ